MSGSILCIVVLQNICIIEVKNNSKVKIPFILFYFIYLQLVQYFHGVCVCVGVCGCPL